MMISKFVEGVSKGRRQQFEQSELQRARDDQRLMKLAEFVDASPLRRDLKEKTKAKIFSNLFSTSRADVPKGPGTKLLEALVGPGGKKPDKKAGDDRINIYTGFVDALANPDNMVNPAAMQSAYFSKMAEVADAAKKSGINDAGQIWSTETLRQMRAAAEQEGVDTKPWEVEGRRVLESGGFAFMAPPGSPERARQDARLRISQRGRASTDQSNVGLVQQPFVMSPVAQPPVPPNAAYNPLMGAGSAVNAPASPRQVQTQQAPDPPRAPVERLDPDKITAEMLKFGPDKNFFDPSTGKQFQGRVYVGEDGETGVHELGTNRKVPGAREWQAADAKVRMSLDELAAHRAEGYLFIDKSPIDKDAKAQRKSVFDGFLRVGNPEAATRAQNSWTTQDHNAEVQKSNRAAAAAAASNAGMNPRQYGVFNGLLKEHSNDKTITAAESTGAFAENIQTIRADPRKGAAQIVLLYGFIKGVDRDSAVREGEVNLARMAQSFLNQYKNTIDRINSNQVISPRAALEIADASEKLIGEVRASARRKDAKFAARASALKVRDGWDSYMGGFTRAYDTAPSPGGRQDPHAVPLNY